MKSLTLNVCQLNKLLDVRTQVNVDDLNVPPPNYWEVCPPSYEEALYYPSVTIKIKELYDINEDELGNTKGITK